MTKFGNGFGYGTTDKLSPEDAFLKTVFEKVQNDGLREKQRRRETRQTIEQIVPPIVKKAPKPVTDSLKALHLSCRRGVPIDRNGMPFLVEKDPYNRNNQYMAYLKKKMLPLNQQSTKSIRSTSLKAKSSVATFGNGHHESGRNLDKEPGINQTPSRKKVYSLPPNKPKG